MEKTIAAIATPPGEGGIAVVRICGPLAIKVAKKLFSKPLDSQATHTVLFGKFLDEGIVIDEGLLILMRAPRSYTGENTVEMNCHGSPLIAKRLLDAAIKAGASPAGPGEFTYWAYLNGKIDLAQAEAVQSMIGAKNQAALLAAKSQLEGSLSKEITLLQTSLIQIAAQLEAWVDFPEEDLEFASKQTIFKNLNQVLSAIEQKITSFEEGAKLFEGYKLALIGLPNVGKSSLMNALLGKERAIVTSVAGTTRDVVSEQLLIGQLHFELLDTAGIRSSNEIVEREGIARSKETLQNADLILFVCDVSLAASREEELLAKICPKEKTLLIWNKIDLAPVPNFAPFDSFPTHIPLSTKTHEGLDLLKSRIEENALKGLLGSKDQVPITQARHKEALIRAKENLKSVIEGLEKGVSPEFACIDLRSCLSCLGSILGIDISEKILDEIFANFCVGK